VTYSDDEQAHHGLAVNNLLVQRSVFLVSSQVGKQKAKRGAARWI